MFIGPCIIVIVEDWKINLMSLAILFHYLCAQHVSGINMSIIRSLRLCCAVVLVLRAEACKTSTTQNQPHQISNTQRSENKTIDVVIEQHSRKLLMMDILISETCWAHKKWNKIASDIKLVFHSSAVLWYSWQFSALNLLKICVHSTLIAWCKTSLNINSVSNVYWTVHHCNSWGMKTNLMSLVILFHFLCAQHVSDINISIFRSLRPCWWITTWVVLFCKDGCFSN